MKWAVNSRVLGVEELNEHAEEGKDDQEKLVGNNPPVQGEVGSCSVGTKDGGVNEYQRVWTFNFLILKEFLVLSFGQAKCWLAAPSSRGDEAEWLQSNTVRAHTAVVSSALVGGIFLGEALQVVLAGL